MLEQINKRIEDIKRDKGIKVLVLSLSDGQCSVIGMRVDKDRFYVAKRMPQKPIDGAVILNSINEVAEEIIDELMHWSV